MKNLNIPVGISDFERIRELNYYYVDKTGLIKTLLQGEMDQVTLITRPRRFGKTMAMNMVASFLDIRKDSKGQPQRFSGAVRPLPGYLLQKRAA